MHSINARERSVSRQSASVSGAGRMPSGMARQIQQALARLSRPSAAKALRQPSIPPTKAPSGMPRTEARDQPRNTKVMARPRCAAGTSSPTHEAACGVKMAGAITASIRSGSSASKVATRVHSRCSAPNHSRDTASSRRRSQPATTAANRGAPMHITKADAEISRPAVATDTCKELLNSLSVAGTSITPVPMTKLPNSSAHSTPGIDGREALST